MNDVMAKFLVLHAEGVSAAPDRLDDVEAATLPTAAVTTWPALVSEGKVKLGEALLVQGTGGVSLFAAVRVGRGHRARILRLAAGESGHRRPGLYRAVCVRTLVGAKERAGRRTANSDAR